MSEPPFQEPAEAVLDVPSWIRTLGCEERQKALYVIAIADNSNFIDMPRKRRGRGAKAGADGTQDGMLNTILPTEGDAASQYEENLLVARIKALSNIEVEMLAWPLLDALRAAQSGYIRIPKWSKSWKYNQYPSFRARFDATVETCRHLNRFAAAPDGETKAGEIAVGKEAIKQRATPSIAASPSTTITSSRAPKRRLNDAFESEAARTHKRMTLENVDGAINGAWSSASSDNGLGSSSGALLGLLGAEAPSFVLHSQTASGRVGGYLGDAGILTGGNDDSPYPATQAALAGFGGNNFLSQLQAPSNCLDGLFSSPSGYSIGSDTSGSCNYVNQYLTSTFRHGFSEGEGFVFDTRFLP
ncbi:hypothetical protein B0T24DRAFT_692069 [Lasiosphaeria ovina]|uniref:Uncharacterized protein n=1 Tax=Lasiosphaeria ovina TaxID=92902 RepID=A0AAE0JTL1_9PEZI|nr:hypothetical protein B0T24DRAFT_692069 [Lasiosphaeria ovina]